MRNIRRCLIERWYAWEDARAIYQDDSEIQVTADGAIDYNPKHTEELAQNSRTPQSASG